MGESSKRLVKIYPEGKKRHLESLMSIINESCGQGNERVLASARCLVTRSKTG